jgi:hypothetical protein
MYFSKPECTASSVTYISCENIKNINAQSYWMKGIIQVTGKNQTMWHIYFQINIRDT